VEASKSAYEKAMGAKGFGKIATQIASAHDYGSEPFFYAEDYHQQVSRRNQARA
jgi:peptide-methionine (S)-S-oxide reductase